ncbi:hypothetical protein DW322_18005 [Rhodococcus rhodnii]|uniref:EcsC family protein n=1 Tax=Rhodococcus rhodnii TaxID=38312 RepID=A0A6P2CJ79_9NOCA|nr:hypothetical protein DW322_18005 [Rhodococcus rhodnii]
MEKLVNSALDGACRVQAPTVRKQVWRLRRAHPDETPEQIIERMRSMFLTAVTGSGGAVGATAAVPGVGTVASLAAVGAESAFFLEAAALYTLGVATVHGIRIDDDDKRRALVLSVVLGEAGMEIVQRTTGSKSRYWARALEGRIPAPVMKTLDNSLVRKFATSFAAKRGALVFGKVLPAGIGAAIGSVGNRALGHRVVKNAHDAFGPPPAQWTDTPGDPAPTS